MGKGERGRVGKGERGEWVRERERRIEMGERGREGEKEKGLGGRGEEEEERESKSVGLADHLVILRVKSRTLAAVMCVGGRFY